MVVVVLVLVIVQGVVIVRATVTAIVRVIEVEESSRTLMQTTCLEFRA